MTDMTIMTDMTKMTDSKTSCIAHSQPDGPLPTYADSLPVGLVVHAVDIPSAGHGGDTVLGGVAAQAQAL